MMIQGVAAMIALDAERSLRVEHAEVLEIQCVSGVLWITQEGDPCDRFIGPGESFSAGRRGVTLVTALEPTVVHVIERDSAPWWSRWGNWFGRHPLVRIPARIAVPSP
jgi:hypothetical protein